MSGDAGGLIAALVFAPIALAGVAALGLAYGALRVGGVLAKAGINYAHKKSVQKQLTVDHCSAELESLYSKMQLSVQNQADSFSALSTKTQKLLDQAADTMKKQAESTEMDLQTLNKVISSTHANLNQVMAQHTQAVQKQILEPGRQQMLSIAAGIDQAAATKAALVDWKNKTAAAQAQQKAVAYDSLRDALASINLMKKLAASCTNDGFRQQCQDLTHAYETAQLHFNNGLYSSAYSGSRTVIRQVAIAVAAQQMEQMELDFTSMQLQARIEGLMEEMEKRRYIHIPAGKDCDEALDEDLNDYSQGHYAKMQEDLKLVLDQVRNPVSPAMVRKIAGEFDSETEPRALKIMEVSQQMMHNHHEKLKVLDVVSEFMEEQNYAMDWAAPVGDDLSQKLVVHFVNKFSNSSISVTLDTQATAGNIVNMAMEVLTFYSNGNPVSEQEKQQLRADLNNALHKAGIAGGVSCQGQVNQPSSQKAMDLEAGVLRTPPKAIL